MMPAENLAEMKNEVEKGFQFLATLRHGGDVYAILKPIFDNLQAKVLEEEIQQRTLADAESVKLLVRNGAPTSEDHEFIVISVHKAMCAEKFICIVEKPSSVPGFAAPIRELPAHQLPEGWNSNPSACSLMYKHKQKPGKQFMLTSTALMDGSILSLIITEKCGLSLRTELDVEELMKSALTNESRDLTIKTQVQALVWQLIPQLAVTPTATISATPSTNGSSQSSIRAPVLSPPSVPMSAPYDFYRLDRIGEGRGDIGGGFAPSSMVPVAGVYRPQFPGIGGGDLHPSFPGVIPQPRGDQGQGSLVGPDHPLFNTPDYGNPDPYGRQSQYDPTCPPGWPQGMPRPRFDSFMPVPGPNGPDFGMPGGFGGGGQGRGVGLPGRRRVPGEPNPDHFRPPGDGDNRFT